MPNNSSSFSQYFPPSSGTDHLSAQVYSLSKEGIISDAVLTHGSATFGIDQTAAIQAILDLASSTYPIYIIWDCKVSITGLRIKGNTYIKALAGCGAIMRTGTLGTLIENYNLSFTTRTDKDIVIEGGIWNGNNPNNTTVGNGTVGINCIFRFYGAENVAIRGNGDPIQLIDSPGYAIHAINVKGYEVEDFIIDCGSGAINMDGVHADGNCSNVVFRNGVITAHDDAVAFNADDQWRFASSVVYPYYPSTAAGPISNVLVDNIILTSQLYGLRILSGASLVDNIVIKNLTGYTNGYGVVIDNFWQAPSNITAAGSGNIGTVQFENLNVAVLATGLQNDCVVNVNCNVQKLIFKDLKRNDFTQAYPTIYITGAGTTVSNLIVDGYDSYDGTSSGAVQHIEVKAATVTNLVVNRATINRVNTSNASALVKTTSSGVITNLVIDGVVANKFDNILNNASGTITTLNASNIIHTSPTAGQASFKTASTIPLITLSNYKGALQTSGTFTEKSGDGFIQTVSSSQYNTAVGYNTLVANVPNNPTGGYENTAVGSLALSGNTNGHDNTAIGAYCMVGNTTGNANTAVGTECFYTNTTGSFNTAMGYNSLKSNLIGNLNTAVGWEALFVNTGDDNTAIGGGALLGNTTALKNVAVGRLAGYQLTTGGSNIAIGYQALVGVTTGTGNVDISTSGTSLPSGSTNIYRLSTGLGSISSHDGFSWAWYGGQRYAYTAKTGTYPITIADYTIECTANTFTVTLPTAVGIAGQVFNIINSGAGTITIATTSSQTFVNVVATPTTLTMATVGSKTVQSNGANWMLISTV